MSILSKAQNCRCNDDDVIRRRRVVVTSGTPSPLVAAPAAAAPMGKDYSSEVNDRAEQIKQQHREPSSPTLAEKIKQIKDRYNPLKTSKDALNKEAAPAVPQARASGLLQKAKKWQVPGLVPPKHPEMDLQKTGKKRSLAALLRAAKESARRGGLRKNDPLTSGASAGAAAGTMRTGGPELDPAGVASIGSAFGKSGLKKNTPAPPPPPPPPPTENEYTRAIQPTQITGTNAQSLVKAKVDAGLDPQAKRDAREARRGGELGVHTGSKHHGTSRMGRFLRAGMNSAARDEAKGKLQTLRRLNKDNRPHPPGSPEDSAHDVVEEGKPLKTAMGEHLNDGKISAMLRHLRNSQKEQGWERSPANQAKGKGN